MLSESEKKTPTDPTIFSTSDFLTIQNTGHNEKSYAHFRADSLEVSVLGVRFKEILHFPDLKSKGFP